MVLHAPGETGLRGGPLAWRVLLLLGLAAGAAVLLLIMGPIRHGVGYYGFPDQRALLGVPHFWNVVSNVPFAIVGIMGMLSLARGGHAEPRWPAAILFIGVFLTAFGSAWYHLYPAAERLLWDRLPMTVIFMSTFAIVLGDRIDARLTKWLPVLVGLGAASVVYWYTGGDGPGGGDLRPYVFVQGFPMLAIPIVLLLFPARRLDGAPLVWAVAIYGVAKILERFDAGVYGALGGTVSGHTLKHVTAAVACWFLIAFTRERRA